MKENNNSKKEMFINKLSLQITSKILHDIYWGIQYSNLNFLLYNQFTTIYNHTRKNRKYL